MARLHGYYDTTSQHQRGQFRVRWSALHAGNMSDVQIQGRRESGRLQSNSADCIPAAAKHWVAVSGRDQSRRMGDAQDSSENIQAHDIRGSKSYYMETSTN